MKKLIALILAIASLFALCSCRKNKANSYDPVPSTAEEATTVMTLQLDGNTYEVKCELYRALFLNYKSTVDGGDSSVWSGENKAEYIAKIDSMILDRVTEIYAAFAICKRIGFDIYSQSVENQIKENVRISVEGGSFNGSAVVGYGSYEAYLAALKAANLNYSVQALLFRYAIATEAINSYYIGTIDPNDVNADMVIGNMTHTKEDVRAFYFSDNCVRVLRASFPKAISYHPAEDAQKLKDKLTTAANSVYTLEEKDQKVFIAIMQSGRYTSSSEVENGYVLGRYNLERSYYKAMTDAAFALETGEVSDYIDLITDVENSYYVLYKATKSDEHFENDYENIRYVYLSNIVGEIIYGAADSLRSTVSYSSFLNSINHSAIKM